MYLRQIVANGVGAIVEWKRMWNQEVLPYLRQQRLVAGRGLRANRLPAGTSLEIVDAGGTARTPGTAILLAKVQTFPVGGVGMGTVKAATAVVSGAIVVDSGAAAIPVVMPYLDGDN